MLGKRFTVRLFDQEVLDKLGEASAKKRGGAQHLIAEAIGKYFGRYNVKRAVGRPVQVKTIEPVRSATPDLDESLDPLQSLNQPIGLMC